MTKEQVKTVQLIKSGTGYSKEYRASYNRYRVIIDGNDISSLFDKAELKNLPYWSSRSEMMAMTCWGTSQEFEAQLALAQWLGWKTKGEEWGDYTRRVTKAITAL